MVLVYKACSCFSRLVNHDSALEFRFLEHDAVTNNFFLFFPLTYVFKYDFCAVVLRMIVGKFLLQARDKIKWSCLSHLFQNIKMFKIIIYI